MSTEYFNDPLGQSIISSFSNLELTFNSMESNFGKLIFISYYIILIPYQFEIIYLLRLIEADFEKYEMDTILAESMRQALDSFDHKV